MKKKHIALIIVSIAAAIGGYILFYKHAPKYTTTQTADVVIMVDKKRAINTAIAEYLTQPSLWSFSSGSDDPKDDRVDWKDAFTIPDYLFLFHEPSQGNNEWHTTLAINNKEDFEKYLKQESFKPLPNHPNIYQKDSGNVFIGVNNQHVLVSVTNNPTNAQQVYTQIFSNKQQLTDSVFTQLKKSAKHISFFAKQGNLLNAPVYGTIHYSKNNFKLQTSITPTIAYTFKNENLSTDTAMLNVQLAQPQFNICNLLDSAAQQKFTNLLNVPAQAILLPTNKAYTLQLQNFANITDTAITYEYDDNFNQVEKKTITNNREPVFGINIIGNNGAALLTNLTNNKVIEPTAKGALFTSIPLAKTYATSSSNGLQLSTEGYKPNNTNTIQAVLFAYLNSKTLLPELGKYLKPDVVDALKDVENIQITATAANNTVAITANVNNLGGGQRLFIVQYNPLYAK
jgi:hypothetical protein